MFEELWAFMEDYGIATREEIGLAVALCGPTVQTLERVFSIRTGHCSMEQFLKGEDCE